MTSAALHVEKIAQLRGWNTWLDVCHKELFAAERAHEILFRAAARPSARPHLARAWRAWDAACEAARSDALKLRHAHKVLGHVAHRLVARAWHGWALAARAEQQRLGDAAAAAERERLHAHRVHLLARHFTGRAQRARPRARSWATAVHEAHRGLLRAESRRHCLQRWAALSQTRAVRRGPSRAWHSWKAGRARALDAGLRAELDAERTRSILRAIATRVRCPHLLQGVGEVAQVARAPPVAEAARDGRAALARVGVGRALTRAWGSLRAVLSRARATPRAFPRLPAD